MESDLRTSASSVPGSGSEPRLDRVCFVGGVIVADSSSSTSSISVKKWNGVAIPDFFLHSKPGLQTQGNCE